MADYRNDDLFHKAGVGIIYVDENLTIQSINDTAKEITGINSMYIGKRVMDLVGWKYLYEGIKKAEYMDRPYERQIVSENGTTWLVNVKILKEKEQFTGSIITLVNIADWVQRELELQLEKEKYQILAEVTNCGLWEYYPRTKEWNQFRDLDDRYSKVGKKIPNYQEQMIRWKLIHTQDQEEFQKFCNSMDRGEENFQYDIRVLDDSEEYRWIRYEGRSIRDEAGELLYVVGRTLNIDAEKKKLENLVQKAEKDPLTNIYNKRASRNRIEFVLKRSKSFDIHALFIIDVDDFKEVNDSSGHLYGDVVLETFAHALLEEFCNCGIVGRIGGDEFIILLRNIKEVEDLDHAAKKIRSIVHKIAKKPKGTKMCTASVGVAVYPKDGMDYESLFKKADIALYFVKDTGKDGYEIYRDDIEYGVDRQSTKKGKGENRKIVDNTLLSSPYVEKRIVNFALDVVNDSKYIREAIPIIFSEIGKYYGLSRISIFENKKYKKSMCISYEWCNEGIYQEKVAFEKVVNQGWVNYELRFDDKKMCICNDINHLNCSKQEKAMYQVAGVRALLQCALYDLDKFYGCINYEVCEESHVWSQSEVETFMAISKIISVYLFQNKDKERLDDEIFFTKAMIKNQRLSNYAIQKDTYELLYVGDYTDEKFPDVILGEPCYKTLYQKETPCNMCPIKCLDPKEKVYSTEIYDETYEVWNSVTVTEVNDIIRGDLYLICQSDVTNFMNRIKAYDTLTGIYSAQKFHIEAERILRINKDNTYAIVCSDIIGFKFINDRWGYTIGDFVLKTYAQVASEIIQKEELCCRIFGDRFTFLLHFQNEILLRKRFESMWHKVSQEVHKVYPKLNFYYANGIYVLREKDEILSLSIDRANIARKTKRSMSKNSITYYDEKFHQQMIKERDLEIKMIEAIKEKEFIVFYHPKVDLKTKKVTAAEALIRWRQKDGSLMFPDDFIPLFEKNGFIEEMDFYVYEEVFSRIRSWLDSGQEPISISVNVSRMHTFDSSFVRRIMNLVEKYRIPTKYIELEITENMILDDVDRLICMIEQLRDYGFLISIDDFGSGYSSLMLLNRLKIDILKLDKEFFLQKVLTNRDRIIVLSILQLAQALGIQVVSEGVETKEQVDFLIEHACDLVQGYYFYKPMSVDSLEKLLHDQEQKEREESGMIR